MVTSFKNNFVDAGTPLPLIVTLQHCLLHCCYVQFLFLHICDHTVSVGVTPLLQVPSLYYFIYPPVKTHGLNQHSFSIHCSQLSQWPVTCVWGVMFYGCANTCYSTECHNGHMTMSTCQTPLKNWMVEKSQWLPQHCIKKNLWGDLICKTLLETKSD